MHIPAEVKHSRRLASNGTELGCEFAQPLPPGNPQSPSPLVASPQMEDVHRAVLEILGTTPGYHLASHDRRIHPRVVFNELITIGLDHQVEPMVCYARDLSQGGICFIAQKQLPPEITILFSPSAVVRL